MKPQDAYFALVIPVTSRPREWDLQQLPGWRAEEMNRQLKSEGVELRWEVCGDA